ncbi:MAG: glycosyl hydrolase [Thermomicrobiaceae bacterium]
MDTKAFQSLEWRLVGPHRAGRVVAVAGHPTETGTFYFGACAGGVWKTTNAGSHWENITDGQLKTSAIGALAVSKSDPNVIYAGTGETAIRSNITHGDGVYKSTDGGRTWNNVGLKETRHIGEIEINPTNPDVVFVAALGHAWGQNEERGVYRTQDGGKTWEKILYESDKAGAIDISMDPNNPRIIFATVWQGQRLPHGAVSGGDDSGLWRSMDGGDTWEDITRNPGLPDGIWGKSGVAVSGAKAGRVWAQVEAENAGVFRSDDYGATWAQVNDDLDNGRRPWYYMHIYADPQDADTVYICNLQFVKSVDGGKTFKQIPTPHGDNHDLWMDPKNPQRMIEGNDGGACVSLDGGKSWSSILNQPTAQFYHVEVDDHFPYRIYGSQQDNFAMRLPMADAEGAISWKNYYEPGGGESGYMRVQPEPPHKVFGGGIGTGLGHGRLLNWDPEEDQRRNITAWPEVHNMGAGAIHLKYRFQWTFPVEFSPHDPKTLYIASQFVHKTTDLGHSYEVISPDLTRNDPDKLQSSGGPLTADNSGAEIYCTIFAFLESPHEKGVFWSGSDDGLVHISRDGGDNWENVTPGDLPEWAMISMIEASPHDPATVYVVATMYKHNDWRPFIYKTTDYGASWTKITNGIPEDDFTRVVREDPERKGLLYAGTELGVYVSLDGGNNWNWLDTNLPIVPIYDLVVKNGDLVAATHGRAFWILDDVSPLRQMQDEIVSKKAHLFQPRDTYKYRFYGRAFGASDDPEDLNFMMNGPVTISYKVKKDATGQDQRVFLDAGHNPPDGVIVHFYLSEKPEDEVTLSFLDADGSEINSYSSKSEEAPWTPKKPGANRFVWNLRGKGATPLESDGAKDRRIQRAEEAVPPRVTPGDYQVKLTVGDETMTESFKILRDPRLKASDDDLKAQFHMKLGIRDLVSSTNEAINQIRSIRDQVEQWAKRADAGDDPEGVRSAAEEVKEKLTGVEGELTQLDAGKAQPGESKIREKLLALTTMIDESDAKPTQGAEEVYKLLGEQLDTQKARLAQLVSEDVKAFTDRVSNANVPPVSA